MTNKSAEMIIIKKNSAFNAMPRCASVARQKLVHPWQKTGSITGHKIQHVPFVTENRYQTFGTKLQLYSLFVISGHNLVLLPFAYVCYCPKCTLTHTLG